MTDVKVSRLLVTRLEGVKTLESLDLVRGFRSGKIPEKEFIARANGYLSITRADQGGALNRAAQRHATSITLPKGLYSRIFGEGERGTKVAAVEDGIRQGVIDPRKVLDYA